MNYIEPILHSRQSRLVSGEITWRAVPDSNSSEARDRAQVAKQWLNAMWERTEMEYKIPKALLLSFCAGVTAFKSFWNKDIGPSYPATKFFERGPLVVEPELDEFGNQLAEGGLVPQESVERFVDEEGNPVEDESQAFRIRMGDTDVAIRTIFNVRLNPEAHGWTSAEGCRYAIDTDIVPIETARSKFPHLADQIRPVEGTESALTYERIVQGVVRASSATSANPFIGRQSGGNDRHEMAAIREYWELPDDNLLPEGRLIVIVGGAVAYDGPFPEQILPYAPLFDTPGTLTPYGRPSVNTMRPPQDVVNRQWSAIVAEMEADGTGRYVSWQVPGVPDQITAQSNRVIQIPMRTTLANRPIGDVFKRLEPGQVAADRWKLIEQAKVALFDVGAYHEVTRGQIPPGLDSGVAIERLLESEAGQLKPAVDALKRTLITIARQQLTIAKAHYEPDQARWIPVDRPDLDYMVENVTGQMLPDPETIVIDLENFRPQSEASMRAEIKELMAGGIIDARRGLKLMDLGHGVDGVFESATRHYGRARRENLAFERGAVVPQEIPGEDGRPPQILFLNAEDGSPLLLPEDDDHAIHMDVHSEIALDDTKEWPLRQAMLMHIAQHRQATMLLQQQAAAMQIQAEGALAQATSKPTQK